MRIARTSWFLECKEIVCALVVAVGVLGAQSASGEIALYGCDNQGRFFVIDTATGIGTLDCLLPTHPDPGATEMEFDMLSRVAVIQGRDGIFSSQQFDIDECFAVGGLAYSGYAFNGLEFVDGVLYGVGILQTCMPSQLMILDPATGAVSPIGPTGLGPISGLAWDPYLEVMYGVTGCGNLGAADMVTIDLSTGEATVVGSTGQYLGSLEFGPDGMLYAGGNNRDGGNLYRIDPADGSATYVGATGFANVTGLVLAAKTIIGALDIKPASCPNPLNIRMFEDTPENAMNKKGGILPVAIVGNEDIDVNNVDISSILLEGVEPISSHVEDVATPFSGEECGCTSDGPDGVMDLTIKFKKSEIAAAIGTVSDGDVISLTVTGTMLDGTPFEASDCVRIASKDPDLPVIEGSDQTALGAATPNPFNPVTTISYELSMDAEVSLIVYDVTGRVVERLVTGVQSAGEHFVQWNAAGIVSGVYFYRLQTNDFVETRRMVLLK